METTNSFDEHIFLETYYQVSGCSSKIGEYSTRIRLLLTELDTHVYRNPQTSKQLRQLQSEYHSVHSKFDGTIPVDEIGKDQKYNQLVDDLKVSQEDVVEFHNELLEDENWNDLERLIKKLPDSPQRKNQILDVDLFSDYSSKDEKQILQDRIRHLEEENSQLKKQLYKIKVAYEKVQQGRLSKSPFVDQAFPSPQGP